MNDEPLPRFLPAPSACHRPAQRRLYRLWRGQGLIGRRPGLAPSGKGERAVMAERVTTADMADALLALRNEVARYLDCHARVSPAQLLDRVTPDRDLIALGRAFDACKIVDGGRIANALEAEADDCCRDCRCRS